MSGGHLAEPPRGGRRVLAVEAARGLAALYVFVYHIVEVYELNERSLGLAYLLKPLSFGYEAVILFFLLSGFSIHYASYSRSLQSVSMIGRFYWLRVVRIYPLASIAVLLTVGLYFLGSTLELGSYAKLLRELSWNSVVANALLLADMRSVEGAWFHTLRTNPPLWSLSYEIVYYLLYPLFWLGSRRLGIGRAVLLGVALSAAAAAVGVLGGPNHLTNVLQLYWIWCAGAYLGELRKRGDRITLDPLVLSGGICISGALWILGRDAFPKFLSSWLIAVSFMLVMAVFVARIPTRERRLTWMLYIPLGISLVALWWHAPRILDYRGSYKLLGGKLALWWVLCVLLSLGCDKRLLTKTMGLALRPFIALGAISYGLYVVHYPLLAFMHSIAPSLGSLPIVVVTVLATATFMELGLQPRIRRILIPREEPRVT